MAATATTLLVVGCPRHSSPFLHVPQPLTKTTHIPKRATWKKLQAQQQPRGRGRGRGRGFGGSPPNHPSNDKLRQKEVEEDVPKANKDEIPQVVIERISVRIVASVVIPMGLGLALLSGFGALRDHNVWDVPFWVPVATSFLTFGASALGIAYGALSSSWDPATNGSVLGVEQLERNWTELWKE